jgi:adenylate cyclase
MGVQTTVVFTDLIGSTAAFEALGNVPATKAVTELTQWICSLFEAHGGRVVKTLGDGVLAVFPDSAAAVDAVAEMQRNHQKRTAQMPEVLRMPIRAGVASGDVEIVAGDCYGDAVNIASRLCDLSGPHEIWANSTALDHVTEGAAMRFRLLGPIHIRGRAEPCTVYQVEWQENESSAFMTMQADLDPLLLAARGDVLGGQIELSWHGMKKSFKAFEMPVHIGRVRHVDFVVNDPRVSRTHARIDWRNGSVMFVDVSSYGSWVRFPGGGADILLRREECVLHGSGQIALGASFTDPDVPALAFTVS